MEDFTKEEATQFFADLFGGEHHINAEVKEHGRGWAIITSKDFATYDFNHLTKLVLLSHERCIRAEIDGCNKFGSIRIAIWKRQREGDIMKRHPTIEEAIERFRNN